MSTRSMLEVNVYLAALHVPERSGAANAILESNVPRERVLRFVHGVGRGELGEVWDEGFGKNAAEGKHATIHRSGVTLSHCLGEDRSS